MPVLFLASSCWRLLQLVCDCCRFLLLTVEFTPTVTKENNIEPRFSLVDIAEDSCASSIYAGWLIRDARCLLATIDCYWPLGTVARHSFHFGLFDIAETSFYPS